MVFVVDLFWIWATIPRGNPSKKLFQERINRILKKKWCEDYL